MLGENIIAAENTNIHGPELVYQNDQHKSSVLGKLNTLRKEGKLCDVIVQVGKNNFPGHKAVLACSSGLLMELFSESEEEGDTRHHFKLPATLDCKSFEILVNFAYTSRLKVPSDHVATVYKTANLLKVQAAAEACSHYLAENLTPANCLSIRTFANCHHDQTLTQLTDSYMQANISEIIQTRGFSDLPNMKFDVFGVTDEELEESGERNLVQRVISWVEEAMFEEQKYNQLCEHPNVLYFTSENYLRDCLNLENSESELDELSQEVNNCQMVQDYKKMKKRKQIRAVKGAKATAWSNRIESVQGSTNLKRKPGSLESLTQQEDEWTLIATYMVTETSCLCIAMLNCNLTVLHIRFRPYPKLDPMDQDDQHNGVKTNGTSSPPLSSPKVTTFMEKQVSLTPLSSMESARASMGTAVIEEKLVVLGGYDRGECLKTVETFDLKTNKWSTMSPMLIPRGRFDVAQIQGKLYALGGSNGVKSLKTAEYYDIEDKKWTKLPDMLQERSTLGATAVQGKVYVIGGWSNSQGMKNCEVYDPETNKWTYIAKLNTRRSQTGICAVKGGKILAVGGCDSWNVLNSAELYDPVMDEWTLLPNMVTQRRGAGVAVFNGKVYAVGGSNGQYSLSCVEIFDPDTQSWTHGPKLNVPRANVGLTVLNNRLFAIGGFSGKKFLDTIEYLGQDSEEWCTFLPSFKARSHTSGSESSDSENNHSVNNNHQIKKSGSVMRKGNEIRQPNGELVDCSSGGVIEGQMVNGQATNS